MGRNVQCFCERFGAYSLDVIDSSKQWKLMANEGIVSRTGMQCRIKTLEVLVH